MTCALDANLGPHSGPLLHRLGKQSFPGRMPKQSSGTREEARMGLALAHRATTMTVTGAGPCYRGFTN